MKPFPRHADLNSAVGDDRFDRKGAMQQILRNLAASEWMRSQIPLARQDLCFVADAEFNRQSASSMSVSRKAHNRFGPTTE